MLNLGELIKVQSNFKKNDSNKFKNGREHMNTCWVALFFDTATGIIVLSTICITYNAV